MATPKQSAIWGNFWQILELSRKLVADYDNLLKEKKLAKKLPMIETAYIDSIIVHLAKIFSNSRNDEFRLEQFKKICRTEIKEELVRIERKYKDIIGKIITNRVKLVAHLDKKFYELCFSEKEIDRMEKDMAKRLNMTIQEAKAAYASMPRTSDKSKERYSVQDFRDDLPQIKAMLEKLNDIWNRSIPFA